MTNFKDQLQEVCSQVDKSFKSHVTLVERLFKEAVQLIFDNYPGLNFFEIKGYTPSFNDGDPCTHWSFLVDPDEACDEYDEEDGFVQNSEFPREVLERLSHKFERDLYFVHDTNWRMAFIRDGDGFRVEEDSWHPEY